ncbi:flagellar assembly protein FliW [Blastococcus haudaquaticus]|uniref:Flagellar assembly factor FliW n=1 Tax=Blastococcus haudaquaticus TaxID=1938745 RepID=A0A286H082_9ACTN|nr:flagellar assembly protein FliW [Blastococcus haudaquaticus]SOE01198.1 flagellar assembly factor FliW [Blastococcus haudaquaticus]
MTPAAAVLAERAHAPAPAAAPTAVVVPAPAVQVLTLVDPLPGFPDHRDYVLVPAEESGRLSWLQAVAPDGPRFLAVAAGVFFPDYAPSVPGAVALSLGLDGLDDIATVQLYCVVSVPDGDVSAATANLRAPVVVNPATHRACQVVLTGSDHPIRRPLRR